MKITRTRIEVEKQAINPTLKIKLDLEFERSKEIPISFSGKLCLNNDKILSVITEYQTNSDRNHNLQSPDSDSKAVDSGFKDQIMIQLSAELTPLAIESIERERDKNATKSVEFYIELVAKSLIVPVERFQYNGSDLVQLDIRREHARVSISQSDWINDFTDKLRIGNFLLLELNIPNEKATGSWKKLFDNLKSQLTEMENNLKNGDWKRAIETSRPFFELLKLRNNNIGDKNLKHELNNILIQEGHNQQGIDQLFSGINSIYQFVSKYSHLADTQGVFKPFPLANKEDAYLLYSLSINLLNLIGKKINRSAIS